MGLVDGTPEADGVLAMLNARSTTLETLDVDARLDRRAAENLMARRKRRFASIAEVDAVPWIGDAMLRRLVDYARAQGWIVDGTVYGRIEGVPFTVAQADATLGLANTASFEILDEEVALDRRAARGIVDRRSFASVEEIAEVPYVGRATLLALRDFAGTASALWSTAHAESALVAATRGLVHVSDIDEKLTVVTFLGVTSIDAGSAKDVLQKTAVDRGGEVPFRDRVVAERTLAKMFDDYTVQNRFWGEEQLAVAGPWREVRAIFETRLTGATVIRVGEYPLGDDVGGAIDLYVLGVTTDGDLVGFSTVSVEP